jgi:hypothetical protein
MRLSLSKQDRTPATNQLGTGSFCWVCEVRPTREELPVVALDPCQHLLLRRVYPWWREVVGVTYKRLCMSRIRSATSSGRCALIGLGGDMMHDLSPAPAGTRLFARHFCPIFYMLFGITGLIVLLPRSYAPARRVAEAMERLVRGQG